MQNHSDLKILICSGSFKDVYSPVEACDMIKIAIEESMADRYSVKIDIVPIVDGGEYSCDVLYRKLKCKKIEVGDVVDPRGIKIDSHYLDLDNNVAFIGSSQILGLSPQYERDKNPLNLTSYGLGQLIGHAISKKFNNVILGLGGTSTADGGIGMAQALGVKFLDDNCKELIPYNGKYLTGSDMVRVNGIVWNSISSIYNKMSITVLCDSRINVRQMSTVTDLKISKYYDDKRELIKEQLELALLKLSKIVGDKLSITESSQNKCCVNLSEREGSGNAGGVNISLFAIFRPRLVDGISYFIDKLELENAVRNADLVVTGEGRFDFTSNKGKGPVGIACLAKKYNKPVLLLCGGIISPLKKYFSGHISNDLPLEVKETGISTIISCHELYENIKMPNSYSEEIELYRRNTPEIFAKTLKLYFQNISKVIL